MAITMKRNTLSTQLIFSIALGLLLTGNTSLVNAFPDKLSQITHSNPAPLKEILLDDSPDDPYYPADKPFYQAPLSLTPSDHFLLSRPIENEILTYRTADYRYGYLIKKEGNVHGGLDIPAPEKTPVLAAGDGTVVFSGYGLLFGEGARDDPYGIAVMIRHDIEHDGFTLYTVYTHLDQPLVQVNDLVKRGQKIGKVGLTGNTSGPHLHFEVRIRDSLGMILQNPELWLVPPLEHGVLAGRITNNMGNLLNNWNLRLTSLDTGNKWQIRTYDIKMIDEHLYDPYYQENFALNDLPAGHYELRTYYNGIAYKCEFEIIPGAVYYLRFLGKQGFVNGDPPGSHKTDFLK